MSRKLRVVDLFAGLKGWSAPFEDRGHEVFSVELDLKFPDISLYADILTLSASDFPWRPDIVLASPPCTSFTTMTMGRNWTYENEPKTDTARLGKALVEHTIELIQDLRPSFAIIENPRARLRTLGIIPERYERRTVWYCRYGEERAKPTDLWGGPFPPSLVMRPGCKNGFPDHIAAPRGSQTGTQGGDSAVIAKIPYELALDVCLAAERDLAQPVPRPSFRMNEPSCVTCNYGIHPSYFVHPDFTWDCPDCGTPCRVEVLISEIVQQVGQ